MRIADYLEMAARRFPDREGFVFGDVRMTFRQARDYAHSVANRLLTVAGLADNAHVGILSQNDHRVTLLQLAINYAGYCWVGLHDRNVPETNAQVLNYTDCELIFFHSALAQAVARMRPLCPGVREWICIDAASEQGPVVEDWISGYEGPVDYRPTRPEDLAFIAPTGGTTGPSKGAAHTQRGAETEAVHINAAYFLGRDNVRLLTVAPLSHVAGHLALALLPTGGTSIILKSFDADLVLDAIARERVTHLFLPPTALYSLLAHPRTASTDCSSLQALLIGAAPVAPEKFKEAVRIFGPVVWEGFGQSETLVPILIKKPEDYLRGDGSFDEDVLRSAGKAWDFVRVEIMDDEGALLAPGERGEIVVRSSFLMQGYYRNPEATAEVASFGFHHTGDIGTMDQRGFVTIVDRKKDMIVTGGFNVFPAEVEAVINEHPDVLDCIVVGAPHDKWGEQVVAVVQLKQGRALSSDALGLFCRDRLGGVKAPKSIEIWPDLPRSAVGKTLRRDVRAKFWASQWRSVG